VVLLVELLAHVQIKRQKLTFSASPKWVQKEDWLLCAMSYELLANP
jgi:hypothetical protein